MGYGVAVGLVACPFCREMFEKGEADACPVCGMSLVAFEKLPPSIEAHDDEIPIAPHDEKLSWAYLGRGRGALGLLGVVGLVLYFLPWMRVEVPFARLYTGLDLGRALGWAYGAGVGWLVLVPTVLSRRTIRQLCGARVAAGFLSAIPGVEALVLAVFPPHTLYFTLGFSHTWAFWGTLLTSALSVAFAVRLGGRIDDVTVSRGTSAGQALQ